MKRRLRNGLGHAALPYGLALLAVTLTLPALWAGVQFDDYYHRAVLLGAESPAAGMQTLFAFLDGDPVRAQRLMDAGVFPWWTLPTAREAFWRPLAALTHWLDYRLWPAAPMVMHAHSLLWFGALIAAVAALYRRVWGVGGVMVAGLAALLYAVDDAHGFAAGWLANRNGLMAALFGVLCVHAYVRWRREAWRPGVLFTPLCLALGLLSAEAALASVAYLAAYALCLDRGPWRARLLALLPVGLVVLAWAVVYRALGYGAWGTAYVDPLREPLAFARAVVERGPILLLGQWAWPPAELYPFLGPSARVALWLMAGLVSAALAWLFVPLLRRSALARFWAVGMLLALLPICAALPANRLLFFTGLGAMGLLAQWLVRVPRAWSHWTAGAGPRACPGGHEGTLAPGGRWSQRPGWRQRPGGHRGPPLPIQTGRLDPALADTWPAALDPRPKLKRAVVRRPSSVVGFLGASLLLIHLLLAPALLPLTAYSPALLGGLEPASLSLPAGAGLAAQTLVMVNAPSFFSASFLSDIRASQGLAVPARVRYLGAGPAALEISRPDAQTLVVVPAGSYVTGFDSVFRGQHHPLALGEVVALEGVTVEVLAFTADQRPAAAAFRFDVPLEDKTLRWVEWRGGVFVPFVLPAVGQTRSLPALLPGAGP